MIALCIGKANYDITIPVENYPIENSKLTVTEKLEGSGGAASNVAYLLAKWNYETYFAGTVGYDDFGSNIKKELEQGKVHTNYMEINYERKTTTTFIINNKSTTSRTQIMIEPEIFHLKKYEFDTTPNIIYSDGFEYSATMSAINKFPNSMMILGAGLTNGDPKEVLAMARNAKYIVFSLEMAEQITKKKLNFEDPQSMLNLYKDLKEKYINNEIIVTLKEKGVLYAYNNNIQYMPTIPVKEVDRTGSGDVFDGAFSYAIGKGYDLEKCMRIANIAAGLSTTKYGAKSSIPTLADVIRYYESKFGPLDVNTDQTPSSENQESITPVEKVVEENKEKVEEVANQ